MFITDPPLLADIGSIHLENYNASFSVNGHTDFKNSLFQLLVKNITFDCEPFILHFDGISDSTDVVSRFLTFGGNVIRDRLSSISYYPASLVKLNKLMNGLLELIPDEIDIPGTDLYLEGGLQDKFKIKKETYMTIPLDLSLQNHKYPYEPENTADFGDFVQNDYQLQLYLSDYLVRSGVWSLYYEDMLKLNGLELPISSTDIDIVLVGQMSRNGFANG